MEWKLLWNHILLNLLAMPYGLWVQYSSERCLSVTTGFAARNLFCTYFSKFYNTLSVLSFIICVCVCSSSVKSVIRNLDTVIPPLFHYSW